MFFPGTQGVKEKITKLLRMKNIFGKIFRARSFKSPVSPHCLFQEWFSYKLKRPCQSEWQMQIPGPHLPKSSNDYVKCSTLSQQEEESKDAKRTCVFEIGETERKQKNTLPRNGRGGERDKMSYNLKN